MSMSDLLEHVPDSFIADARAKANGLMNATDGATVVYPFYDAPEYFRAFSRSGGDEDFVIIHVGELGAYWSWKLAVCDEQTDVIPQTDHDGQSIYFTITSHA